ncbi:N-acetylneuraminate synthase [Photobacterium sagamiensis]|uniref:N-acetylneuraminate synthase n=1 Tax=Photobacterium sagamiensis TaxID=2910241 RepID=UPI003D12E1BF
MVYIIAEAGVNHNGSRELALELVDIAANAGADAVKFQTFTADKLVRKGAEKAEYQKRETGEGDQHSMLKKLEMSPELHQELIERCELRGIEFMSTAFDEDALDFLLAHGLKRIKVPSGEITNHPFIRYIASKNVPIILSTGMATLDDIVEAKAVIEDERTKCDFKEPIEKVLTILHCTSNYPAAPEDVNLKAMNTIAETTRVPVGYSDHTLGVAVSTGAVALGATVIEKHFSKSRDLPGPDHKASLEPNELADLVRQIRIITKALGSAEKKPTESELPVRELVRRSVTIDKNIKAGEVISQSDIVLMRPGTGILPKYLDDVIGMVAVRDLSPGDTLNWSDIK